MLSLPPERIGLSAGRRRFETGRTKRKRKDSYTQLIQMGDRWYDAQLGRWLSADTIVPDPANPQNWNRYAYVGNNPVGNVDPGGHITVPADCVRDPVCNKWAREKGEQDGEGVSVDETTDATSESESRMLELKSIALGLSARTQLPPNDPAYIDDAEAMAQLYDQGTLLYLDYYGPMEDCDAFILELGVVVGGMEVKGSTYEHTMSTLQGNFRQDNAFRLIRSGDPEDPLGQFYIGYDNFRRPDGLTGFRSDVVQFGHNQVRHFVDGVVVAHAFWGAGKQTALDGEFGSEPWDYVLYQEAFLFHDMLMLHGIHFGAGNYIRYYLAED
jgi:RHS repeat-associated protein